MGIKGLMKVIADHVPHAIREHEIKHFFGRKIAIDASMCMYQFLVAVRTDGANLMNEDGEVTSHLQGMFYRTLRLLDHGIKPVYVFDGKPPEMKSGELEKRKERRDQAEADLKVATDAGIQADIEKHTRRLVKVTPEHNEEAKQLLRLMGIPVVEAPCEAEAMCAELAKKGLVYGVGTEDMDALTFGSPRLLRHLMSPASRNEPIVEIELEKILEGLNMDMPKFIDLCILLGCDYTTTIPKVGPVTAMDLIKTHGSIEKIIEYIKSDPKKLEKHPISDDFRYEQAADLFKNPEIAPAEEITLKWTEPDQEGLVNFLVNQKGFQEARVRTGIERMLKSKDKSSQQRIESFFTIIPKKPKEGAAADSKKRKAADTKATAAKKKK